MAGVTPLMRECSNCGQPRRCRFTGLRWVCDGRDGCWDKLFPRGDAA